MKKAQKEFKPGEIEPKWQKIWLESKIYQPSFDEAKNPFYNLMMFPYPSAEGLHVGNMYAFTGSDIYGRFKRMQQKSVFEPIGLDGFGIHSENYAMKIGEHPKELSKKTESNFYRQLRLTGNGYAWENKVETYDPDYYKWTQWIFVKLFKAGLAYRGQGEVNWCPSCLTVLADEQVVKKSKIEEEVNVCERCGTEVIKKKLTQWYFKITDYAQRLLEDLDKIDWSEKVTTAQRNWIGKSEGAEIVFDIDIDKTYSVRIFTTRADTIFGVTFLALAVDHGLVTTILEHAKGDVQQAIRKFLSVSKNKADKTGATEEKNGIFTGFYATNPLSGEKIPVYIADYVLTGYGTGAVMGVPAHDQRDWEFAKKYGIEIKQVIKGKSDNISREAFTSYGELVNSGNYSGLKSKQAIGKLTNDLKKMGKGDKSVNWHLRDWIISRQRYWGPPIPMIFCEKCASQGENWFTNSSALVLGNSLSRGQRSLDTIHKAGLAPNSEAAPSRATSKRTETTWDSAGWYPVPEEDLPVKLPYVEKFMPTGSGVSPLAQDENFVNVKCPQCGSGAKRETDVSDTFLDSAWYFLRYPSKKITDKPWDSEITQKWLPVNMYIGGAEHSVLHLLYSRFLTKVFYDLKLIDFNEPFTKFRAHGLLIKDGAKMSKSKGNVVNPDDYIVKFGADTLRTYLMFCGRFSEGGDFRDEGIEGMHKFLKRVWRLVIEMTSDERLTTNLKKESDFMMHKTIKKVTEDIENLSYNTAIAALMEWMNYLEGKVAKASEVSNESKVVSRQELEVLIKLLAPFAPHMTEELWQVNFSSAKNESDFNSIHTESWPEFDPELAKADNVIIIVQVNGKVREKLEVQRGISESEAVDLARKSNNVSKYINESAISKVIFVKDRLINFVTT